MASDLTEQNENEQENTEQNDLQQIESLKIQVRGGDETQQSWLTFTFLTTLLEKVIVQNNDLFSIWIRYPVVSYLTWHLYQGQNSLEQIS